MTATEPLELGQTPLEIKKPAEADRRFWSATTILNVLDKPALLYWSAEQTAKCAVTQETTWRAMVEDSGEEAAVKWLRDARFRRLKNELTDAEFGSGVHDLCESYALTGERPEVDRAKFLNDTEAAAKCLDQFDTWLNTFQPEYQATEVTVYSPKYGYAGTSDAFLTLQGFRAITDYKSSKKSWDAKGKPTGLYPEIGLQLAAYRWAELAAVWRPRVNEVYRRRYYLLSAAEQALAVPVPEVDGGIGIKITPDHCTAFPVRCDEQIHEAFLFCLELARHQFEVAKTIIGEPLIAGAT